MTFSKLEKSLIVAAIIALFATLFMLTRLVTGLTYLPPPPELGPPLEFGDAACPLPLERHLCSL